MRLCSRLQPEVLNKKDIAGYFVHLQVHNNKFILESMIIEWNKQKRQSQLTLPLKKEQSDYIRKGNRPSGIWAL